MKRLLLSVLILALLAGCVPASSPAPRASTTTPLFLPERKSEAAIWISSLEGYEAHAEYASQLIFERFGADLTFQGFGGRGYTNAEFLNGLNNDDVWIVYPHDAVSLLNRGYLGDFYDLAREIAPRYLQRAAAENPPGELTLMPVGFNQYEHQRLAVLVRRDVDNGPVRTAEEYKELLTTLRGEFPENAPGAAWPELYRTYTNGSTLALSLFLPQYGYTPLDGLFERDDLINFLWYKNDTGKIDAFYSLDAAAQAYGDLASWREDGLLDLLGPTDAADSGDYPTFLVTITELYLAQSQYGIPGFSELDFSQYNFYTLYPETAPGLAINAGAIPNSYAVAGPDAEESVIQFLLLMEALEDQDNLRTFMFGVEGLDYTLEGDVINMQPDRTEYLEWPGPYQFRKTEFQFKTSLEETAEAQMEAFYPGGFLQERFIIPQTLELPYPLLDLRAIAQTIAANDHPQAEFRWQVSQDLKFLDTLLPKGTYDNMYRVAAETFQKIQNKKDSGVLLDMLESIKK